MIPCAHSLIYCITCIIYCSQGNREQPAHYLKQYKNAGKLLRVYGALSLVHISGISIRIRTNKRQNKGMQSSLRRIERHKHKHKNIVEA